MPHLDGTGPAGKGAGTGGMLGECAVSAEEYRAARKTEPRPQRWYGRQRIIALPAEAPEGLESPASAHFGHASHFVLVALADDGTAEVSAVRNDGHAEGGCMEPVRLLHRLGVTELVVSGIGLRPLTALQQHGIRVFRGDEQRTVEETTLALLAGLLPEMSVHHACAGHGGCH